MASRKAANPQQGGYYRYLGIFRQMFELFLSSGYGNSMAREENWLPSLIYQLSRPFNLCRVSLERRFIARQIYSRRVIELCLVDENIPGYVKMHRSGTPRPGNMKSFFECPGQ